MSTEVKRLYRSRSERMVGGVCSGLGYFFGIDPTLARLLFIFGTLMGAQGVLVYLILLIVVPEEPLDVSLSDPKPGQTVEAEA